MMKKDSKNLHENIETLIGPNAFFEGNIKTDKGIKIDGKLSGKIETTAGVFVGEDAVIEGDIEAELVIIGGTVKGNVKAPGGIEIMTKAKMHGDIETNILTIAEGAFFEGKSQMYKKNNNTAEQKTTDTKNGEKLK